MMYLRPGNLEKDFIVKRKKTDISDTGTPYSGYVDTGLLVSGVLADADKNQSDRKKHLWNQDQHSLTHTIVSKGEPVAKKGDLLAMDDRYFSSFWLMIQERWELPPSIMQRKGMI